MLSAQRSWSIGKRLSPITVFCKFLCFYCINVIRLSYSSCLLKSSPYQPASLCRLFGSLWYKSLPLCLRSSPSHPPVFARPHRLSLCEMAQDTPTAVLFITNSESGQANTILALVAELLSRPNTEVHVASFVALEKRVAALRDQVLSQPSSSSLIFHAIHCVDMNTALRQRGIRDEDLIHPPTTKSYKAYDIASAIVTAWSCEGTSHFLTYPLPLE